MDPKITHSLSGLLEDLKDTRAAVEVGPICRVAVERLVQWMGPNEAWALVLGVLGEWQRNA